MLSREDDRLYTRFHIRDDQNLFSVMEWMCLREISQIVRSCSRCISGMRSCEAGLRPHSIQSQPSNNGKRDRRMGHQELTEKSDPLKLDRPNELAETCIQSRGARLPGRNGASHGHSHFFQTQLELKQGGKTRFDSTACSLLFSHLRLPCTQPPKPQGLVRKRQTPGDPSLSAILHTQQRMTVSHLSDPAS